MQRQMSDMMKKLGKQGGRGMLKGFMDQISGKGNLDAEFNIRSVIDTKAIWFISP